MYLQAAIFDLDDTLHDKSSTLEAFASWQFFCAGLAEFGIDLSAWQRIYVGLNNLRIEKTEVFDRLSSHFGLPDTLHRTLMKEFDHELGRHAVPFDGAIALLSECKSRGMKIGIVTNGRDTFQRSKIDGMGITSMIDSIVTSGGCSIKKPDHRIFLACLDQLTVAANRTAFVGDDFEADMRPALDMGMTAIWKSAQRSDLVAFSSDSFSRIGDFLFSLHQA